MTAKAILHMLSPLKHMSPFDVNMALDAGFDSVTPYVNVTLDEVTGLVQDAMFSRPPHDAVRTGVFIGGRDVILALDMLNAARAALLKPFELSIFADPAGSFTTAAAMVACVEKVLQDKFQKSLKGARVVVFGATGVVGFCTGVISALEGAQVQLAGHDGAARVQKIADEIKKRFKVDTKAADGGDNAKIRTLLADADIALCCAKAGVQILSRADVAAASNLKIAADVNAVPPLGVEGVDLFANGAPIDGAKALGVGALAIGNVKYRTESGLFQRMASGGAPLCLDFRDAFALARTLA
ncbi:MAG: methylenetetrahydromethanopterin dehydrogenase [Hyphomicrobiales bacterium]|nr:methylenetetrahydromethanopterin dehydrogenase [Hyphomicrobiales bacterium]